MRWIWGAALMGVCFTGNAGATSPMRVPDPTWPKTIEVFLRPHIKACTDQTKEERALIYFRLSAHNEVTAVNVLTKKAQGAFQSCLRSKAVGQYFNLDIGLEPAAQVWIRIPQCKPAIRIDKDGNRRIKPECLPPFGP
jgi:hypothetical protein